MNSYLDLRAIAQEHLAANVNSNLYFLIDHAGMPGLHRKLAETSAEWASLFEGTKERGALSVAPILVLVCGSGILRMQRRLSEWIGEHGIYTSSLMMLESSLPISSLACRLTKRLDVRLSENMVAMLRFFDPRVFEKLVKILSVEQARAMLSPAEKWSYVDRKGRVVSVNAEFDIVENFELPLQLNEAQEFGLVDASEPDQVLALLRENVPNLLSRLHLVKQYEFVVHNIKAAKDLGLRSTVDLVLYSAVALSQGVEFATGPIWSDLMTDVKSGRIEFAEVVAANDNVSI